MVRTVKLGGAKYLCMPEPFKHHFLPVFYLKSWSSEDGRLVEFSIPFKNEVKPKRVHPKGTGYIDKLYAIEGLTGNVSYEIEKNFLSPVDSKASTAFNALISGSNVKPQDRTAWSHFIMTLLMRMPTEIALLKELIKKLDFELGRKLFDMFLRHIPVEFHDEVQKAFEQHKISAIERSADHVMKSMSSEDIVSRVSQMEWIVLDVGSAPHELLTSDRPVVVVRNDRTAGNTVIALPIGPRKLFVAATSRSLIRELQMTSSKKVAEAMNMEVVTGANRFAYGRSDKQLTFVQNRFGKNKKPSFIEEILRAADVNAEEMANSLSIFDDNDMRGEIERAILMHRERFK